VGLELFFPKVNGVNHKNLSTGRVVFIPMWGATYTHTLHSYPQCKNHANIVIHRKLQSYPQFCTVLSTDMPKLSTGRGAARAPLKNIRTYLDTKKGENRKLNKNDLQLRMIIIYKDLIASAESTALLKPAGEKAPQSAL